MPFDPAVNTADNIQVFTNLLTGANANSKERINAPNLENRFTTTTSAWRRSAGDSIVHVADAMLATFRAAKANAGITDRQLLDARDGIQRLYKSYKKKSNCDNSMT